MAKRFKKPNGRYSFIRKDSKNSPKQSRNSPLSELEELLDDDECWDERTTTVPGIVINMPRQTKRPEKESAGPPSNFKTIATSIALAIIAILQVLKELGYVK